MKIKEILDKLRQQPPNENSEAIKTNIKKIKEICNRDYYDQLFYGNAALNRQMLLNKEIAMLLTPEVIHYLFTNEPTKEERIHRNSNDSILTKGSINLRDAIYNGFADGLMTVCLMPNNEENYSLYLYKKQQENYAQNTLSIVESIKTAASNIPGASEIEVENIYEVSLVEQFDAIVKEIKHLKETKQSANLLLVPGYSTQEMRDQVRTGFLILCQRLSLSLQNLAKNETLDSFCEKFLNNPHAMLDGDVIHLFYDRAHIEAAIEQDQQILIGNISYKYEDILKKMVEKISTHSADYPDVAKEQLYLRFNLVETDLRNRFGAFSKADEKPYVLTQGPLPKSTYTSQLQIITRKLMNNRSFYIEKNADNEDIIVFSTLKEGKHSPDSRFNLTRVIKYANIQHLELEPIDYAAYDLYHKEHSEFKSHLTDQKLKELQPRYADLHPAEMKALSLFTSENYFSHMNALMRGTYPFEKGGRSSIRDVIIHSVMCGSALAKIPDQSIQKSYRFEGIWDDEDKARQDERLQTALHKGVITVRGFISSTTSALMNTININTFYKKGRPDQTVIFELCNLKGKYIAPLSKHGYEQEYLIPPTQLQILGVKKTGQKTIFEASIVSDLAHVDSEMLRTSSEEFKPLETGLDDTDNLSFRIIKDKLASFLQAQIELYKPGMWNSIWASITDETTSKFFQICYDALRKVNERDEDKWPKIKCILFNIHEISRTGTKNISFSSFLELEKEFKSYSPGLQ